jgi:hypothetical protein
MNSICVELQFRMLSLQLNHELSGADEFGTRMFCICGEEPRVETVRNLKHRSGYKNKKNIYLKLPAMNHIQS